MATPIKNQQEILGKLGIKELNPMQKEALVSIKTKKDTILLSPTGTGKTLAFLLPVIEELDATLEEVQVLILVPSRELAIQIEQVTREMGSGFKANAVYGGRAFSKDKIELSHPPAILIGTPGRVADHLRRETFSVDNIKILVLDEFDKSLEVGFEAEMKEIINSLPQLKKRILTSATQNIKIPSFAGLKEPETINYLKEGVAGLHTEVVVAPKRDKLETLLKLLQSTGNEPGIIFCNFKDSIQEVSDFLERNGMQHACFSGGMEQKDRERALIKFRNGTYRLIIATDLAARGIDIPEIKFIIHYELPHRKEEFTHRNGRTARMHGEGTAYVLQYEKESLPEYIAPDSYTKNLESDSQASKPKQTKWTTLFISGGRKDKISKGDIAGLFLKQGNLIKDELGVIELKQDCAFVSVPPAKAEKLVQELNNTRLKKKKVRISRV
ncbi:DEAD/DEAH box helicase [Salegentibacter sp. F188]|uniref:DEAD/DEAH box helicase n=1 Tax=Autumnicola patrickiae TaxID=3075591 RepID=A0ABU3E2J3_9FLAO|nr:DEAD/DEAH box helicase [Salegentibacter sp. F188]MDT0690150.1 DEAD/DEAH box helicase [Salegentibacter sp. F188]